MIKYIVCLFLCLFLAWEMTPFSCEGASDLRIESVRQEAARVSCAGENDCFIAAADASAAVTKINDAILHVPINWQSSLFSKLLKLKTNWAVRDVFGLFHIRLAVNSPLNRSFTPNSIRYLCRYYIYTLSHILI